MGNMNGKETGVSGNAQSGNMPSKLPVSGYGTGKGPNGGLPKGKSGNVTSGGKGANATHTKS